MMPTDLDRTLAWLEDRMASYACRAGKREYAAWRALIEVARAAYEDHRGCVREARDLEPCRFCRALAALGPATPKEST